MWDGSHAETVKELQDMLYKSLKERVTQAEVDAIVTKIVENAKWCKGAPQELFLKLITGKFFPQVNDLTGGTSAPSEPLSREDAEKILAQYGYVKTTN